MDKDPALAQTEEFLDYVSRGAAKVTPAALHELYGKLPELRGRFAEVQAEGFPKTPEQLEFLADVVTAFVSDGCREIPYAAISEAAFALLYLDREIDLIPDFLPRVGLADDAAVAATVLHRHASDFGRFAAEQGKNWAEFGPNQVTG